MWVGRGEKVQRDVGREDLLWEGRLKEGRETFLEDAQSWEAWISIPGSIAPFAWAGEGLCAHFCLTSSCDHLGVCWAPGPEVAWCLHKGRSG